MSSLQNIPYDLLLSIAQHLDLADIYALQLTCKHLRYAIRTRPVYRGLAVSLLRRCRALPLYGFKRFSDLSTDQLVEVVNRAAQLEQAWLTRTPRPAVNAFVPEGEEAVDGIAKSSDATGWGVTSKYWYKVVGTPPDEEVDWLSPITASYTLCATKSGKVVCWDVHRDVGIAEWNPGERWELWKCRVEFERRIVYFTMAKVLRGKEDEKVMQFELMQIHFPEQQTSDSDEEGKPAFSTLRSFKTLGTVMNVFLLDPEARLLAGFVWIGRFNTIGLYVLLDWNKEEYVFVDTGIQCTNTANWSCILCDGSIVIHCEEATFACQHFFPLSVLAQHVTVSNSSPSFVPRMTTRLKPVRSISRGFIFPVLPPESYVLPFRQPVVHNFLIAGPGNQIHPIILPQVEDPAPPIDANNPPNPWSDQLWYPESAHFVRQWWPTLPSIPRLSCTVVLLAQHHPLTHVTKYVLAQHYFTVPLSTSNAETDPNDAMMRMWYISVPFEVVCVSDQMEEEEEEETPETPPRQRPLLAVDFGHAVWLEHVRAADDDEDEEPYERGQKRLRFVSFPGVRLEGEGHAVRSAIGTGGGPDGAFEMEGTARTLAIPKELDLHEVETINIDQSQGAVILSVRQGKIFILCYE